MIRKAVICERNNEIWTAKFDAPSKEFDLKNLCSEGMESFLKNKIETIKR